MTHPSLHPLPREIVRYRNLCFHQVFWIRTSDPSDDGKGPRIDGWLHQPPARLEDWRVGMQNGVVTGVEIAPGQYLADVDLDWTDPIAAWTKPFLPDTDFGVGRSSKPVSHAFYTTPTPLTYRKFTDVKIGENEPITFVEIRGSNHQTMMPPSMHFESGERLELRDGTIAHVPSEDLIKGVTAYACGCLLGRHWPANGPLTNQHDTAGYAAATLCKLGVDPKIVPTIIDMAACLGGDDRVRDRVRYAQDTVKKFRAGKLRLAGEKKLAKELGEAVVDQLRDWLLKEPSEDAIRMEGGELSPIVDRAEDALLTVGVRIYRRGGVLVRPIAIDKISDDDLIRRAVGSMVLSEVREPWLLEQMGQVVEWWKFSERRGWEKADPKSLYSRTLLERGEWRFPALRGVITAPTLGRRRSCAIPRRSRISISARRAD